MLRFTASWSLCVIIAAQANLNVGVLGTMTQTNEQDLHQQNARRLSFFSAIRQSSSNHHRRELQLQQQEVCRDDDGVNAPPNLEGFIDLTYNSVCTCTEGNNIDTLENFDPSAGFDIDVFNQLISDLFVVIDWSCENECATCFPSGDCALIDTAFALNFQGIDADFTLEELLGGGISPDGGADQFLTGGQTQTICSQFTVGQTGTVCLEDTTDVADIGAADVVSDRPCVLRYNNVSCESCTITAIGCIVASCSVHGIAAVDTCTNTGVDTLFQILPYYTGAKQPSELTVGSCDVGEEPVSAPAPVSVSAPAPAPLSSPVTAPLSSPVSAPVSAPMPAPVSAPVSVPLSSPVSTPVSAPLSSPVSAPVSAPSSPVSAPVSAPVPTPVSAPVSAPVLKPSEPSRPSSESSHSSSSSSDCTGSILDVAKATPELTTLVVLLGQTGLAKTLSKEGSYTVFAPNNGAFVDLPLDVLEYFGKNMHELKKVLLYHVVDEELFSSDLEDDSSLTTLEGSHVNIELNPVRVNEIPVTTADIDACNGVVHVIDGVLIPPDFSVSSKSHSKSSHHSSDSFDSKSSNDNSSSSSGDSSNGKGKGGSNSSTSSHGKGKGGSNSTKSSKGKGKGGSKSTKRSKGKGTSSSNGSIRVRFFRFKRFRGKSGNRRVF